jgi:phosphohistidine phosphatase
MNLYLVRHGDAVPKDVDPARPLSDVGRERVRAIAGAMRDAGVAASRVVHSGKARARETAEILAEAVAAGTSPEAVDGVKAKDPVGAFAEQVRSGDKDVMVVGHVPHLAKLVALLVAGNEELPVVAFTPGTVVRLEQREDGRFTMGWMLRPVLCGAPPPA